MNSADVLALINAGDYERAEDALMSLDGQHQEVSKGMLLSLRALLRFDQRRHDEALSAIAEAEAIEPSELAHYVRHADMLLDLGRWENAIAVLDKIIELSTQRGDVFFLDDSKLRLSFCLRKNNDSHGSLNALAGVSDSAATFLDGRWITKQDL